MDIKNFERELKYLESKDKTLVFEDVLGVFYKYGYEKLEERDKKKRESYFDDNNLSIVKRGDVVRSSMHYNKEGTYSHFMYKKNISKPEVPYVSKYEYGSDRFVLVKDFISSLKMDDINVQEVPVLYGEVTRKTAVFGKDGRKLLVSYDITEYYRKTDGNKVKEKMLEIEDWTTPYTLNAENDEQDRHLIEIHRLLENNLPIELTKDSKPYRGFLLLGEQDIVESSQCRIIAI